MDSASLLAWSSADYSPIDVIEQFKDDFPMVVMVKDGYCGDSPSECLSQSEVRFRNYK